MHIAGYRFWLDTEQLLIQLDGVLIMFQGLGILHIADMLADERVPAFS